MDFTRGKTSSSFQSSYDSSHIFKAPPAETFAGNDDLEQGKSNSSTIFNSSWDASCGNSSYPHHKLDSGTNKNLHHCYSKTTEPEPCGKKSKFQEQYWACAIPSTLPPCPDRSSPHWDPNKEYQDLLDYTYPLNPKYVLCKETEGNEADPFFHDSGVDLNSYNLSYDSKLHSVNLSSQEDYKERKCKYTSTNYLGSPYAFSTPLFKKPFYQNHKSSDSSNEDSFEELSLYASKVDLSKGLSPCYIPPRCSEKSNSTTASSVPTRKAKKSRQFIPTTKVLPLHKDLESDEEYLSLPPHLNEIECLATHLKDMSLSIHRNDHTNDAQDKDGRQNWLSFEYCDSQEGRNDKKNDSTEEPLHRGPLFESDVMGNMRHSQKQSETGTTFNKFSCLRDMLDGTLLFDSLEMTGHSEKVQENKSLVQSIQRFCHHLDNLIQWLYSVAKITDNWIPPKPDVESIQLALSLYLKFKRDVVEHQPLADTVVKDGELLLKYMSLNSSVLKDTLALISKQSEELERHAERLYASVLDAMDTITDDSLGRCGNLKHCVTVEMN